MIILHTAPTLLSVLVNNIMISSCSLNRTHEIDKFMATSFPFFGARNDRMSKLSFDVAISSLLLCAATDLLT